MASTGLIGTGQAQSQMLQRKTAASEIMSQSDYLADRVSNLVSRMGDKLSEITNPCGPATENKCDAVTSYPPYFNGLRNNFDRISDSLDAMEDILSRVEL